MSGFCENFLVIFLWDEIEQRCFGNIREFLEKWKRTISFRELLIRAIFMSICNLIPAF
jgi:hypothetical protein